MEGTSARHGNGVQGIRQRSGLGMELTACGNETFPSWGRPYGCATSLIGIGPVTRRYDLVAIVTIECDVLVYLVAKLSGQAQEGRGEQVARSSSDSQCEIDVM